MWYGGGCDLTPFYVQQDDFAAFHTFWRATCDSHDVQVRARRYGGGVHSSHSAASGAGG